MLDKFEHSPRQTKRLFTGATLLLGLMTMLFAGSQLAATKWADNFYIFITLAVPGTSLFFWGYRQFHPQHLNKNSLFPKPNS